MTTTGCSALPCYPILRGDATNSQLSVEEQKAGPFCYAPPGRGLSSYTGVPSDIRQKCCFVGFEPSQAMSLSRLA